jgi:diacylglycerol kinase (ATP)
LRVGIILNAVSRQKQKFYSSILPALQAHHHTTVFETEFAGHARDLAAAHGSNCDVLFAAGGDGTLHQVLNGIMALQNRPVLGVIPIGSGNDFAGACGIRAEAKYLLELLQKPPHSTDIGKIYCHDDDGNAIEEYFMNVCSAGMGPTTVREMANMPSWLGAQGRYLAAIVKTFFSHQPEELELASEKFSWKGRARVVAVANGKSFGNKIYVAPLANLDDGLFNLFVGGDVPLIRFLWYLQQIKSKQMVNAQQVHYSVANDLKLSSSKPAKLEADGELVGWLPATIRMDKKAIDMLR